MATQRLLDTKQTAELLSISERHLRELCYRREVPFVKVGRLVRFDVKAIEKYIAANTIKAAS